MMKLLTVLFALVGFSTATNFTISHKNRVILAGATSTIKCYSSDSVPIWHYYGLNWGTTPCGFDSSHLQPGISLCPSASRISASYSTASNRNETSLHIRSAQLTDAGTYFCGTSNPYVFQNTHAITVGVMAANPTVELSDVDRCVLDDQNVSLTCQFTYNGTHLWDFLIQIGSSGQYHSMRLRDAQDAPAIRHASSTFMATRHSVETYECKVGFLQLRDYLINGSTRQQWYCDDELTSSPLSFTRITNCSTPEIKFFINSGSPVDSEASLTVGDVVTCYAEGALSYRWINVYNNSDTLAYGNTLNMSQYGNFSYQCGVFVYCSANVYCPFIKTLAGFTKDLVSTPIPENADKKTLEIYRWVTIALAASLLVIIIIGITTIVCILKCKCASTIGTRRNDRTRQSSSHELSTTTTEGGRGRSRSNISTEPSQRHGNLYHDTLGTAEEPDYLTPTIPPKMKPHGDQRKSDYQNLNSAVKEARPPVYDDIHPPRTT